MSDEERAYEFLSDRGLWESSDVSAQDVALLAAQFAAAREDERRRVLEEAARVIQCNGDECDERGHRDSSDCDGDDRRAERIRSLVTPTPAHVPAYPGPSAHCAYCGQMCIVGEKCPARTP